jgi:proteasome accessory factor B
MRTDAETVLFEIVELMSRPHGASVKEICERVGCTRTSFYRYKAKLESFRVPLTEKDDYDGNTSSKRWYVDKTVYGNMVPIRLDHMERMMLRSILDRTRFFEKTALKPHMDKLKTKLNVALIHDRAAIVPTTFYSFKGNVSYEGKEEIINCLCESIEERHRCLVTYRAAHETEAKSYEIDPYTLVDHNNALYVVVCIPKYDSIRILAVERIQNLEKTTNTFRIPDTFDPANYLQTSFGITVEEPIRVRVRFTKLAAFYVRERTWGQEQTIEEDSDGSIMLSFTAAGTEEIASWILSWGKHAKVLEPESLAIKLKCELEEALARY